VTRPATLLAGAAALVVAALAVVVVRAQSGGETRRPAAAERRRRAGPDVHVAQSRLGQILVARDEHTLYLFLGDKARRSACSGTCARVWPPLIVHGAPRGGVGIDAGKLTTTVRADHERQLVYNGHPLYEMSADGRAGDMVGQGFLGTWFVVSPAGDRIGKPTDTVPGYGS
jgi:predicted lipoprotein with Yx(FWY)xxD motif